jgi:hypothetical protein
MYAAMFELMRGNHARSAAPNSFELTRLAREHDLPCFALSAHFLSVGRRLRATP